MRTRAIVVAAVFVVGAALVCALPARAQLYRWTDASGTDYYTTDLASIPPAYRESAKDIGAPTPGPPQPTAPPSPVGLVIPYTAGGPLVVDALINGTPVRLMLDTGADRTLISPAAMARAGIDVSSGTPVQVRGVTGEAMASLVSVPRLDLAGTRVGPVVVVVHTITGQSTDGLLGRDVLDAFTLTMDSAGQRAVLVPR
jgi:clan AA aspartic protease (TIGR02281 family)